MIADNDRLNFLLAYGYIPNAEVKLITHLVKAGVDPTILLDYCLEQQYGPAYWRQPEIDPFNQWVERTSFNGLVFVNPCDRNRIDAAITQSTEVREVR